jgi:hypothetical protein
MDNEPKKGFAYWFTNVFWYHYGKMSIAAVFVLIAVIVLTVEAINKEKYDLNIAVILSGEISTSQTNELKKQLYDTVGDINGDGKVIINVQTINIGDGESFEDNHARLQLYLALPEYTLFIMDEQYSDTYSKKEDFFDKLSAYGIESNDPTDRRVYIGDSSIMKTIGDYECYALLADWTTSGKGDQEWTAAAVRVLKAIINSK